MFNFPEPAEQKLPKPGCIFNGEGKEVSLKKAQAYARYRARHKMLVALYDLQSIPTDILQEAGYCHNDLTRLTSSIREADKQLKKTFTTCSSCHKALTGRARRKDVSDKKLSYRYCDICGASPAAVKWNEELPNDQLNFTSLHKMSLKKATSIVAEKNPELFL